MLEPKEYKTWELFKAGIARFGEDTIRVFNFEIGPKNDRYEIWGLVGGRAIGYTIMFSDQTAKEDFDDNYADKINLYNKAPVMSKSISEGDTVMWTDTADIQATTPDITNIGLGKHIGWNFSENSNLIKSGADSEHDPAAINFINTQPIPDNKKRKRIIFSFNQKIRLKDGKVFFNNCPAKLRLDFYIVVYNIKTNSWNIYSHPFSFYIEGDGMLEFPAQASTDSIPKDSKFYLEITTDGAGGSAVEDNVSSGRIICQIERRNSV